MFESIASSIANTIRNTIAIGTATRNAPWLTAAAILALFLVVS